MLAPKYPLWEIRRRDDGRFEVLVDGFVRTTCRVREDAEHWVAAVIGSKKPAASSDGMLRRAVELT